MEMKERGLSTGALAGIVVAIVVVAVVVPVAAVLLLRGGGGAGEAILDTLPVYQGAQPAPENVSQEVINGLLTGMGSPSGWVGKMYITQASPATVIDWYKTQMSGWTKLTDNTMESYGITYYVLAYQKVSDAAAIVTFTYPGVGNCLALAAGPKTPSTPGGGTTGSIVGTWSGSHLGSTETFTFNSNGTYSWSSGTDQANGTWSMSGDILTLDTTEWKVVFGTDSMQWYEKTPDGTWMSSPSRSFTRVT